jgi:hypothetical protein
MRECILFMHGKGRKQVFCGFKLGKNWSCLGFSHVGAAAGCDLLILFFKSRIKKSPPAAAPTGIGRSIRMPRCEVNLNHSLKHNDVFLNGYGRRTRAKFQCAADISAAFF